MTAAEKYALCVKGLKEFAQQAGFSQAVIGLSGGIDSALVATMSVDAFGADNVHGVLLPGPYSSSHSVTDARTLAENLNIADSTISIVKPFEAFNSAFFDAGLAPLKGSASENTQARCRMVCLMALSNAHNWMLVNTGNKSEALVGYATLHGDMAGAYGPIGGLYKTEVFELSRWRNAQGEAEGTGAPIPRNILEKAPSAELSPDQEDEKCLGVTYEELDRILMLLAEEDKTAEEIVASGFDKALVDHVFTLVKRNAFKRRFAPPFPQNIIH